MFRYTSAVTEQDFAVPSDNVSI